jgi:hypothetical protein
MSAIRNESLATRAAELRQILWVIERPACERQARLDLLAQCAERGPVADAYVDWCGEHIICTHAEYVRMLERINAQLWRDAVGRVWFDRCAAEDA